MQSKLAVSFLAFAATAAAQLQFLTQPQAVTAGSSATWTWSGATGPVSLILRTGNPSALGVVGSLATGSTSGSFTWQVPATTVDGVYALEVVDANGDMNYSATFNVSGGATGTIATIATTGAATAQPTSTLAGSTSSTASLPSLTSTTASAKNNSSMSTSTMSTATSTRSSTSATTSVGNLNAAGALTASPFAFLITAVLGLFIV